MRNKIAAVCGTLCLSLALSGCSVSGMDPQTLMSPPKANADQQSIHKLLQGSSSDITFIYPKSGEYRSAVIMQDFTGDGERDALGFYELEDKSVEVQFLVKNGEDQTWQTAASFQNSATQVDRVCFGDLDGDGSQDVLIGWGSAVGVTGRTASVHAYMYHDGTVEETPLGTYGEMAVTDLDRDEKNEVFTIDKYVPAEEEGDEPSPAMARLYVYNNGAVQQAASAPADNSISTYTALQSGRLTSTFSGIIVDGAKADGSMTSQVFYLRDSLLVNLPSGVNEEGYSNLYTRPAGAGFISRDINGDGVLELPCAVQLPCLAEDTALDATSYVVEWMRFREDGPGSVTIRTLMNPGENYWFRLPYALFGKITASNDSAKRTVTYTSVVVDDDGQPLLGQPLFAIRVFTRTEWDSRGSTSGYEQLATLGDLVYGIQTITTDEEQLTVVEHVKTNFRFITE